MRLYFLLAFICKTFMVWPGANNQSDYNITRYTQVLFGWIKYSYCFNYPVMSILWSVSLVKDTGVVGENLRTVTSHWQTLSHNVVLSTPHHEQRFELKTFVVTGTDNTGNCQFNYHTIWLFVFCLFFKFCLFCHCLVYPSLYRFWLSLWHLQTFLTNSRLFIRKKK